MKTGNKDFDTWYVFFNGKEKSNTKFISLLKKIDGYFLTQSPPKDIGDLSMPDLGLLEDDFRKVANSNNKTELIDEKTRIVLSVYFNINLNPFKKKYGEIFSEVIEMALVEGDYEKYGFQFEKIVQIFLNKNYIDKNDFVSISILRGIELQERYPEDIDNEKLKKEIRFNKIKVFLGI